MSTALNISLGSPSKMESKSKREAQDLHRLLQERMTELGLLQTEWSKKENDLRAQSEDLVSKLRELQNTASSQQLAEQAKHVSQMNEMVNSHHDHMMELQEELDQLLGVTEGQSEFDDFDNEIEELRAQLHEAENLTVQASVHNELGDDDDEADERIEELENQLQEMDQVYQQVLAQRDEDARRSTQMIEDIIIKYESAEDTHQQELGAIINELNEFDASKTERIAEIQKEVAESKKQIAGQLRNLLSKMTSLEREISASHNAHNKKMTELHDEAEALRNSLEMYTARQKQQLKESSANSKRYGEEKRAYVMKHKQLQMLNSELIREKVEHQTLMKDLTKMDDVVLSQMGNGRESGSFSVSKL